MSRENGFTIIELLIVVMLMGIVLSVILPVSYDMYASYKASMRAQEIMTYVSGIRREAFLYSERKIISAQDGNITVDGETKKFNEVRINIAEPVVFFRNGTSSGGVIVLRMGEVVQRIVVQAPLGSLSLERGT